MFIACYGLRLQLPKMVVREILCLAFVDELLNGGNPETTVYLTKLAVLDPNHGLKIAIYKENGLIDFWIQKGADHTHLLFNGVHEYENAFEYLCKYQTESLLDYIPADYSVIKKAITHGRHVYDVIMQNFVYYKRYDLFKKLYKEYPVPAAVYLNSPLNKLTRTDIFLLKHGHFRDGELDEYFQYFISNNCYDMADMLLKRYPALAKAREKIYLSRYSLTRVLFDIFKKYQLNILDCIDSDMLTKDIIAGCCFPIYELGEEYLYLASRCGNVEFFKLNAARFKEKLNITKIMNKECARYFVTL